MINKIGQVMIYVNDQDAVAKFWTEKVGFVIKSENEPNAAERWIEIAPTKDAATTFVLQDKVAVAKAQPEMNLGTPSILLYGDNLDAMYEDFKAKGITVGALVDIPNMGRVFNFADPENNYFAILQK
ncbi:VOC family protein [Listeria grandensis]|uniref:VOC family protein n=1 Tax=Listeria grandensis TaxID=1494963 RepID=A0A7X1CR60_9LIST|nr:VOC family protein [Listeria grandensis]MBC1474761.1 VOC family protein [Listeria grandensis]MBC1937732.1 VOC family protein [Listeria grandensis]MBC6316722.1 VOC family protein [Listeria grandensis]